MSKKRPRIVITQGDSNGIGPEVILKCLTDSRVLKFMEPVVIGSGHVLRIHADALGYRDLPMQVVTRMPEQVSADGITVLDVVPGETPAVAFGQITSAAGRLSMQAVECAIDLCLEGKAEAMVTAPISKEAISKAGYQDPGHTEFIAHRTGSDSFTMMMVADKLRVGLVTGHIPIWDVPKKVTHAAILEKLGIIAQSLSRDFGITHPRMAVLGLNPHAGDGGVMGREEQDTIRPAIEQACQEGHLVFGPFPADGFFAISEYGVYDAVLAMYHDQGLIPFKTLAFDTGVNYTAGLPIVRTSPDHGTALNIAGKGQAKPGSMRSAIFLAIDIVRRRLNAAGEHKAS